MGFYKPAISAGARYLAFKLADLDLHLRQEDFSILYNQNQL